MKVAEFPVTSVAVLAHRGSPGPGRPENTVSAVSAALAGQADGVEVDVRLTVDGTLVCSHDPDVEYEAGQLLNVAANTFTSLRSLPLAQEQYLASLEEVLAAAAAHGRRPLVVEAKPCSDRNLPARTTDVLSAIVADFSSALEITVSSFDSALLELAHPKLNVLGVRTALLGSRFTPACELLRRAIADGHDEMHPYLLCLAKAPEVIDAAHAAKLGVTCWTVNRAKHVAVLAGLGVDGLITDDPATVANTLATVGGSGRQPEVPTVQYDGRVTAGEQQFIRREVDR